ncbi:Bug family tripartite tricarboxylate transporter substrate binding protein [Sediminispirochaeta bajacaliforniensis]|uniref:Bug family tripartite tricarboxylate transporter substrate binding protein n=1 Tax=Sediminispirochaeta bajacaliforniensis TaxID=148 RepID=UPI00035F3FF7|nr:tripartite tricarboxylate transporter substrate-binding protein [Sediminispirochaeta bajacaliforniensis]
MKKSFVSLLVLAICFALAAPIFAEGQREGGDVQYPKGALDFVAPSGAGGGWDLTIRTVAKVLKDTGLVKVPMPVRNNPGAGGAVHLASLQEKPKADNIITVYSPPLILTKLSGSTDLNYENVTPLANLIADYAVFVVKADSKYNSIMDVMNALKKDPKSVKIGGTSSAGSMDHIQFLIMARAAGVKNLRQIDYVNFNDSGAAQVMGGHIDLFSTGLSEVRGLIESGDLKALAQTADHRVGEGVVAAIPTCMEAGIPETFVNWRGLFGPPEMPQYAVDFWEDTLNQMVKTEEWKQAMIKNGWDDYYLEGPEYLEFLKRVDQSYRGILDEIGMLAD